MGNGEHKSRQKEGENKTHHCSRIRALASVAEGAERASLLWISVGAYAAAGLPCDVIALAVVESCAVSQSTVDCRKSSCLARIWHSFLRLLVDLDRLHVSLVEKIIDCFIHLFVFLPIVIQRAFCTVSFPLQFFVLWL